MRKINAAVKTKKTRITKKNDIRTDQGVMDADGNVVFDADGHVVFAGDFVSLLDKNGLELIDEDTFEDVVKVIGSTLKDKVVIDGVEYESKDFRLTRQTKN